LLVSSNTYIAKAPGSIMLMGEHAVIYNKPALVAAVDKFISATLVKSAEKNTNKFQITSNLGVLVISIEDLLASKKVKHGNFSFVIEVIKYFINKNPGKTKNLFQYELQISSELSSTVGLGTSAAVIVAVYKVFLDYLNIKEDKHVSFKNLKQIMLNVQKVGSGADIAASLYQGIVYFDSNNLSNIKVIDKNKLDNIPDVILIYSGYKTKTADVINIVKQNIDAVGVSIYSKIFDAIEECVNLGYKSIINNNYELLGKIFSIHQGLQDSLGVNDLVLSEIIYNLRKDNNILGSKISGSGLGDCILALLSPKYKSENHKIFNNNIFLDKYKIISLSLSLLN
tara:strand:- start:2992 stop:4011 length:1020 start_codon:yes stop_codon:yes gene_type:complete